MSETNSQTNDRTFQKAHLISVKYFTEDQLAYSSKMCENKD